MDNIIKYKLSQYKDIYFLNEPGTVVLTYNISDDSTYVKRRIEKEKLNIYKRIKELNNFSLPKIYEIFECDNEAIVIEEYIKGDSLEKLVKENGVLGKDYACRIMLDLCSALKAIHGINIIHRDISPDNIIIDNSGRARLLDFDISRQGNKNQSTDTTILGTVGFASPEQFGFAQTDVRSDIYSMGVLFNFILTGNLVQKGIYVVEPIHSIITKATRIDPNLRYFNVNEFENAVNSCISKERQIKLKNTIESESNFMHKIRAYKKGIEWGFYPLPGFRTNNLAKKIVASFFYVIFVLWSIGMFIEYGFDIDALICEMMYIILYLVPIWWFGNHGRQWDIIPRIRNLKYGVRLFIAIIAYFVVLLLFLINVPVPAMKKN